MPKQLTQDELHARRNQGKEWLRSSRLLKSFVKQVEKTLDKLEHWDDQVASNHICRNLQKELKGMGDDEIDDDRTETQLEKIFAIIAMNRDREIPQSFRGWACPKYWKETLNDIDRLLCNQTLISKRLNNIILASANVIPSHILKRAREVAFENDDRAKEITFLREQVGKKTERINEVAATMGQHYQENKRLREENDELRAAYDKLSASHEKLQKRNGDLLTENIQLSTRLEEVADIRDDRDALQNNNE